MSFPRYPKYKDSGVEWLGEVPEHWSTVPCRAIVREQTAKNEGGSCGDYLSVMANVGVIPYEEKGDVGNKKPEDLSKCKMVAKGDFVINSMNYGIGSYGISAYEGVCSPVYIVLTPRLDIVESRFAYRIFENRGFQTYAQSFGNGILAHRCAINWDILKSIGTPVPPLSEQRSILVFLDRETAKIDALITEQQRLIELLQEKRQAVISHAVTKGLNPDVPMKDSGIEWLGEVPEHWEESRIDRVSDFVNGKAHEPFVDDNGKFICVNSRFVSTNGEAVKMCSENLTPAEHDDVLMVMSDLPNGRALARTFHVRDGRPYAINQRVCAIRANAAFPRFLFYLLNRNPWFLQRDDGLNQTHLPSVAFRKMPLFLPPLTEQQRIAERLDRVEELAVALATETENAITLLQERRSALISAAVTGQIDVRGLAGSEAA